MKNLFSKIRRNPDFGAVLVLIAFLGLGSSASMRHLVDAGMWRLREVPLEPRIAGVPLLPTPPPAAPRAPRLPR